MMKVGIIDYGMGNLDSVARAVDQCGGVAVVSSDPGDLSATDLLILPGVGAFEDGMAHLRERGLDAFIVDQVNRHAVPILGICLGMQLMATTGAEGTGTLGLGLIPGCVERFVPGDAAVRIPHVGWNEVEPIKASPLFKGIATGTDFYFVHSYHFICNDEADVVARTPYCGSFVSAVQRGSVAGVQFHPEKSQRAGFQLLRNVLSA